MRLSSLRRRWLGLAVLFVTLPVYLGIPGRGWAVPGDVNGDGKTDVQDFNQIQDHILGTHALTGTPLQSADVNGDGRVDVADLIALRLPLTHLMNSAPFEDEEGVAVTRETILRFSAPLDPATVNPGSIFAEFGGALLSSQVHLSPDRKTVTLFYDPPLPGSSRVRVTVEGSMLKDAAGNFVDGDRDSFPGGTGTIDFDTLSLTSFPGTTVSGRVFASELVAGNANTTATLNLPLEGVRISVQGADSEIFAVTDNMGNFSLQNAPADRFFVHIDGRAVTSAIIGGQSVQTHYPAGPYFPFVGKAWTPVPGHEVNIGDIFLPLILAGTLQPVSSSQDTNITFTPDVLAANPGLAGVSITVPADSLFSDDGTRGGMVGIAPVSPDRLPGPLPPGLELPLVITVQTNGPSNFDVPVPVCFPNLPDPGTHAPLPPGTKNFLYSFNHDKGVWEAIGPMTVSADGQLICTDPGVGILAPGWHGSGPPPVTPPPCGECCIAGGGAGPAPPPPPISPSPPILTRWEGASLTALAAGSGTAPQPICVQPPCQPSPVAAALCVSSAFLVAVAGLATCILGGALCLVAIKNLQLCGLGVAACALGVAGLLAQAVLFCAAQFGCLGKNSLPIESYNPLARPVEAADNNKFPFQVAIETGDPIADQLFSIEGQMLQLIYQFRPGEVVPDEILTQALALQSQADLVAGGSATQYLHDFALAEEVKAGDAIDSEILQLPGNAPPYPVLFKATIARPGGELIIRDQTGPFGQYQLFVPRDGTLVEVSFYDPRTKAFASVMPFHRTDVKFPLPRFYLTLLDERFRDSDGDGLPDIIEPVLGTDPANPDSDHDGIPDGAEVNQGTNPLDGLPAITGVIASADTPGNAVDVTASNDLVAAADGDAGVSVFNVFNGLEPRIIAQVDTPGFAQRVALSGRLLAVADGPGGLEIIDLIDPPAAHIIHQVSVDPGIEAASVTVAAGVAYVGLSDGFILAVDMAKGLIVSSAALSSGGVVQDLFLEGDLLYALTDNKLFVVDYQSGNLIVLGSTDSPFVTTPNRRLFVGGGVAYTVHGKGYNTFSLADPTLPVLISAANTGEFGWKQVALNGSGVAVAAAGPNATDDGQHNVQLYDASDPSQTNVFLTEFATPGIARSVSIFNALAYDADGAAGLQVINYLPYDSQATSPTITLSANFSLVPPQAEEGKLARVTANVTDDVQVRNVEFFIDGVKVATDGNFPFEHRFITPQRSHQSSFRLKARATDTGGNYTETDEITVNLTADITAPVVTLFRPRGGNRAVTRLLAGFNEPINPSTIQSSSFELFFDGPYPLIGSPSSIPLSGGVSSYDENSRTAFLDFAAPLPDGVYHVALTTAIADLAGNPLSADFSASFVTGDAVFWVGSSDDWSLGPDWSQGTVPQAADAVIADVPEDVLITHSLGSDSIKNFLSQERFTMSGGTLNVAQTLQVNNTFTLNGGTISGATILPGSGGQGVSVPANSTLSHVTMNADISMFAGGGQFNFLDIDEKLTLNGKLRLFGGAGSSGAAVSFSGAGEHVLDGTGQVLFQGGSIGLNGGSGGLRIASGISVGGTADGGISNLSTNEGTLDFTGSIDGTNWVNAGIIRSTTGTNLLLGGSWTNNAEISAQDATLTLSGTYVNNASITAVNSTVNLGGTFTLANLGTFSRTGGLVQITGTLNNAPGLTLNSTTGNWRLGGVIQGGTIDTLDGTIMDAVGGELHDVTLNGTLSILPGGGIFNSVSVFGTFLLNGEVQLHGGAGISGAALGFPGPGEHVLQGTGRVTFEGGASSLAAGGGTLRIAPGMTVQGAGDGIRDLSTNQGTINATGVISIVGTNWTNEGLMRSNTGAQISTLNGSWTNAGRVESAPGSAFFASTGFTQSSAGTLAIEIQGATAGQFGILTVTGAAALAGTLEITRTGGFEPDIGATFIILTSDTSVSGTFPTVTGSSAGTGKHFQVNYSATNVTLEVVAGP